MGYGKVMTVCLLGAEGTLVTVETSVVKAAANGDSARFLMSGLPDSVVSQSQTRIRSAIANSSLHLPEQVTSVNFAPASVPTRGSAVDLAVAVSILTASDVIPDGPLTDSVLLAELGLDGSLRGVPGVLPALSAARDSGVRTAIVSPANAAEAALIDGLRIVAPDTLTELVSWLHGKCDLPPPSPAEEDRRDQGPDLSDLRGQQRERTALELAAAGGHNLFLIGPPGSGKTMLAERLPALLPPLSRSEAVEVTSLHSLREAHDGSRVRLIQRPPFQAPHHSSTMQSLLGGGHREIGPGALSLAHRGVLFLDEAPEWKREVLDGLREPLESGEVVLHRAHNIVRFPARALLVLAANPCPCAAARPMDCTCAPGKRRRYLAKLSRPLLDRIDLHLEVRPPSPAALLDEQPTAEATAVAARRVAEAREAARHRWSTAGERWACNADVPPSRLRSTTWRLPASVTRELNSLLRHERLTPRGYDRALKLAWTIGDLAGKERPQADDVATACEYRVGVRGGAL
ncbi:YifB family Mg chelatase-like AAA ATPase [Haloglycomyces albus]|uniref:YifB family Mg chelatase-like AAA ATPase n=1 Tax=Haloglycomyces albus TaxID=526067 RepID=UPI00046CDDF8|nr:YifB family Mg chelatase-like AAA ATPase [Haloglycomyces albus]